MLPVYLHPGLRARLAPLGQRAARPAAQARRGKVRQAGGCWDTCLQGLWQACWGWKWRAERRRPACSAPSLPPSAPPKRALAATLCSGRRAARSHEKGLLGLDQPYVPSELQRDLLKEAQGVSGGGLAGNRLAACPTPTGALLCYPVGLNSEALALLPVQLCSGAAGGEEAEEGQPAVGSEGGGAALWVRCGCLGCKPNLMGACLKCLLCLPGGLIQLLWEAGGSWPKSTASIGHTLWPDLLCLLRVLQVGTASVAAVSTTPLQQVAATALGGSLFQTPRPLFAARTAHTLTVLEAGEVEGSEG